MSEVTERLKEIEKLLEEHQSKHFDVLSDGTKFEEFCIGCAELRAENKGIEETRKEYEQNPINAMREKLIRENIKKELLERLKEKKVCFHEVENHERCSHKEEDGCYVNLIDFKDIEQVLK